MSAKTAACIETSSAVVISSHSRRSGLAAKARTMATLWRSPPDSWAGIRFSVASPSRTSASRSAAFARRCDRGTRLQSRKGWAIRLMMRWRGFNEASGFCKISWIDRSCDKRQSVPRAARVSATGEMGEVYRYRRRRDDLCDPGEDIRDNRAWGKWRALWRRSVAKSIPVFMVAARLSWPRTP